MVIIINKFLFIYFDRWKIISFFFIKSGTAGVWRIRAIEDAGGWKDRTTVEDMDLAVRASLRGWKFVFVGDLEVQMKLPNFPKLPFVH